MNSPAVEQNLETSIRRLTLVRTLLAVATALAALSALSAPAVARTRSQPADDRVDVTVIEISGLLDRIQARFIGSVISGERDHAVVIVRLDSRGSVASEGEMRELEQAIERSAAPVAVWVGPSRGSKAAGGSERIVKAAAVAGGVPGATAEGVDLEVDAPTLGDFIVALDGRAGIDMPTEVVRRDGRPPQRQLSPDVRVSFAEPAFTQQMLHAVSTPTAAYLLVTIALLLLVFEFFTGGIGVAGAVAVVSLALGAFGLGALPTRPAALALLAIGALGYGVDVQVGVPRAWTVIGTASYAAGTFFLFDGLSVPIPVQILILLAVVAFMVGAMPAVVRTRYSTPTIGRASMVGEEGVAATDVSPDGIVTVRGAPWRARTNRATPIREGDGVRVAAIDGLLLEVEPLEGAAQDYRERARREGDGG